MAYTVELTTTYTTRQGIAADYHAARVPTIPAAVAKFRQHWDRVGRRHGTRLDVTVTSDTGERLIAKTISRPY